MIDAPNNFAPQDEKRYFSLVRKSGHRIGWNEPSSERADNHHPRRQEAPGLQPWGGMAPPSTSLGEPALRRRAAVIQP